ncbi:MAG: type II toxin-antitoxin system VapC family toxin [Prevotella sp.]|nr:type II toxin-antitoxin system VapC family toxin [Prevotella sp.]
MRYLIDTHIFIWYAQEQHRLSPDVLALFDDYENQFYISSESLKELVLLWNKKPHIRKWWKSPLELIRSIEDEYGFRVLYLHKEHYETYASLQINEAQDHNDPSDHLIISHAITNRMPLISADTRFPFYESQGLELIQNKG